MNSQAVEWNFMKFGTGGSPNWNFWSHLICNLTAAILVTFLHELVQCFSAQTKKHA